VGAGDSPRFAFITGDAGDLAGAVDVALMARTVDGPRRFMTADSVRVEVR